MNSDELLNGSSSTQQASNEISQPSAEIHQGHKEVFYKIEEPIPQVRPDVLFHVGPLWIANSTATLLFIVFLIGVVSIYTSNKLTIIASRTQIIFELLYEAILNIIASITGNKNDAKLITPYLGSVMVFLVVANLLPIAPLISSFTYDIGGQHVPLFRGATTDFNVTLTLAVAVVILLQIIGVVVQGPAKYLSHFIKISDVVKGFKNGFGSGAVSLVSFFVGLIEIVAEIAKMASLSLRLFGNMFAHEVLTVILLGAFAYIVPAIWMGMGILVGVVQALVFTSLVTVYLSLLRSQKESH